jgi:hypothetical protein
MQNIIKEIAQKNKQDKEQAEKDYQKNSLILWAKEYIKELFGSVIGWLANNILKVEVTNPQNKMRILNFPKIQRTKDVQTRDAINNLGKELQELQKIAENIKLEIPEKQQIEGSVRVENQIEIPKVEIPEFPKQLQIHSLPKYVSEKLDSIKRSISSLKLDPSIEVKQPEIKIDIDRISTDLKNVLEAIKSLDVQPQVNVDLEAVIKACNKTTEAINSLQFPVPNFQSSWQRSLTMQSEDLGKEYTWTTDGGKDVVETITFIARDGKTYRKTYSYDGSGKIESETAWTEV